MSATFPLPPFLPTKLTLRLDHALIEEAKAYAAAQGSSVSQLVADYFAALRPVARRAAPKNTSWLDALDPLTRALVGAAVPAASHAAGTSAAKPSEEDYRAHLRAKHLGTAAAKPKTRKAARA